MSIHRSFWPAFQKRWAAVLCEQTEGLQLWSENMTQALRRGILEVPNSAEAHVALAQLNVRLSRLESARLSSDDTFLDEVTRALFVGYGSALLQSPMSSPLNLPLRGASLSSSSDELESPESVLEYGELKLSLDQLCQWLRSLKLVPRRIFSLEDFDSQIIGRALARELDIEVSVADGDGFTHSKSLIVSADNRSLLASPLRTVFPAQVLYSFNLHREGGVIVPDVSGISSAESGLPWQEERLSSRKIAGIVERIFVAPTVPPANDDEWPSRLEFYRARREWLTAGNSCYSRTFMSPETL